MSNKDRRHPTISHQDMIEKGEAAQQAKRAKAETAASIQDCFQLDEFTRVRRLLEQRLENYRSRLESPTCAELDAASSRGAIHELRWLLSLADGDPTGLSNAADGLTQMGKDKKS